MSRVGGLTLWGTLALAAAAPWVRPGGAGAADAAPVYLVRPVDGTVDVSNWPPVQEVRVIGGAAGEAVEIKGEVGLRLGGPLPVEIVQPERVGRGAETAGPLQIDDSDPIRVWVENPPPAPAAAPQFAAFAFYGKLSGVEERLRRIFTPSSGRIFHLTDLLADSRPDAPLKLRVIATPRSVGGAVAGGELGEIPLAILDLRKSSSLRLATPVPLKGEFALEAEAVAAGQAGTTFSLIALGYLLPK